eukprot:CAMPEP_0170581346 /NCGR_PEP_ID=MMETSP0224-20130122/6986_1 /TAXON_ID=285029 /ORGANISM="Togula jolla, Strain CCCM 725" /LENGTH=236 /DNA_ID=CAMNT_0010904467 /DNA_START=53 /DNA_END=763 /DNA_ORIENTATION=+
MSVPPRAALLAAGAIGAAAYTTARLLLKRRGEASLAAQSLSVATACLAAAHAVDAVHFLRIAIQDVACKLQPRAKISEADKVSYRCWPPDVDRNSHMNNAKFMRVLNYARRNFWMRNGMWDFVRMRSPRANMVVTASTIRYRREIKCYMRYNVVTRLVHWDNACFYLEHRFEGLLDGFVLAISYVKYRLVAADKPEPAHVLAALDPDFAEGYTGPPADLVAWIKYDELSSAALRPK